MSALRAGMARAQAAIDSDWREQFRVSQLELPGIDQFTGVLDRASQRHG
jgi:hypothetical protein